MNKFIRNATLSHGDGGEKLFLSFSYLKDIKRGFSQWINCYLACWCYILLVSRLRVQSSPKHVFFFN